jgi:hypothetical protein
MSTPGGLPTDMKINLHEEGLRSTGLEIHEAPKTKRIYKRKIEVEM